MIKFLYLRVACFIYEQNAFLDVIVFLRTMVLTAETSHRRICCALRNIRNCVTAGDTPLSACKYSTDMHHNTRRVHWWPGTQQV